MLQCHHCHPGLPLLPGCKGWRVMGCRGADGLVIPKNTATEANSDSWHANECELDPGFFVVKISCSCDNQARYTMTTLPKDPKDPWQEKMFKPHGTTLAQTLLSHAWVLFMIYCEWRLVVLTWYQELLVQNIIPNSILRNTKQREKLVSIPCPVERPSSPIKINSPHDNGGCNDHHPCYISYVKTTSAHLYSVLKLSGGPAKF